MKRRMSTSVIILAAYAVIFLLFDFIIPTFFKGLTSYGGFFPFFFFFPFLFGRGLRTGRKNNRNSSGNSQPEDQVLNENYNSSEWEARNRTAYDEFGIPVKKMPSRIWYFVGIAAIFAVSILLFLYRGIFAF